MKSSQARARAPGFTLLAPVMMALWLLPSRPVAAAVVEARFAEYQVKAAFLKNFVKFVEWPVPTAALTLCILGDDPFKEFLAGSDDVGSGRRLSYRRITTVSDAGNCQVVFVPHGERTALPEILSALDGKPVLTVGDGAGMAGSGLMLSFLIEGQKVRFDANLTPARKVGLIMSSRLLGLAKTVHGPR